MNTYHKIQTVFKRNPDTNYKTLVIGDYTRPEFKYLKDNIWEFTEKVDGTNIRILWNRAYGVNHSNGFSCNEEGTNWTANIEIRGKTDRAQLSPLLVKKIKKIVTVDKIKAIFTDPYVSVCLYGEGYGGKIQKGGKYRKNQSFVLFDIKIGHNWLKRTDVIMVGTELGLDVVPIIKTGTLQHGIDMVRKGFKSAWGDFTAEGLVGRPLLELKGRDGSRIITKLKYKDF